MVRRQLGVDKSHKMSGVVAQRNLWGEGPDCMVNPVFGIKALF